MFETKPDVVVISFGCEVGVPDLDELVRHCCGKWEHLGVPPIGRDRLLAAIRRTILDMSDEYGRIMRDPSIWQDAVDGEGE